MPKKRKVSDATFFVTRRVGRVVGDHRVFRGGGRVGVGVSGGVVSSTLLYVLHARQRWIPVRTELVPLYVGAGPVPDALAAVCSKIGLPCQVVSPVEGMNVPDRLLQAAGDLGLQAIALGDVIEDRAAAVLGGLVFDGVLAPLPTVDETQGRLPFIRPFAMIAEDAILRAAADNGISGPPPPLGGRREWLERLLVATAGDRHDLLTNLVTAPDRIRKDYLV
ncbi:MAG: hypothetical protein ABIK09_02955 [Pseudomonadota bacterium]